MNMSAPKENIFKKIRKALSQTTPIPFSKSEGNSPVFRLSTQEMEIEFGEQFSRLMGKFVYCGDEQEAKHHLQTLLINNKWEKIVCREEALKPFMPAALSRGYDDLANADAAITSCEALVARTGSIILSSAQQSGRTASIYAPVHLCIAFTDQLVYDVKDGLQMMKEKYPGRIPSLVTFATGPSRTADIEKTLVVGVHGPKEVYVFLVERALPSTESPI